ncbi:MAG: hypothetical protein DRQ02_06710, partial [Candidatus Latescibacterota bacterium]
MVYLEHKTGQKTFDSPKEGKNGSTWNSGVRVGVPMLKHRAERTKPAEAGSGRFSALRSLSLDVHV